MRLFVSIDIPVQNGEVIRRCIPEFKGWRMTPVHQYHITLFFIGDCTNLESEEISQKLNKIVFEPFHLQISSLGVFSNLDDPSVLWAGIERTHELNDLQARIDKILRKYNPKKRSNPFVPHITLARKKRSLNRMDQTINVVMEKELPESGFPVQEFYLKESKLKPSGSEHVIRKTFRAIG